MSAIKYYLLHFDEDDYAEVVETFDDCYYEYEEAVHLARLHNKSNKEDS